MREAYFQAKGHPHGGHSFYKENQKMMGITYLVFSIAYCTWSFATLRVVFLIYPLYRHTRSMQGMFGVSPPIVITLESNM